MTSTRFYLNLPRAHGGKYPCYYPLEESTSIPGAQAENRRRQGRRHPGERITRLGAWRRGLPRLAGTTRVHGMGCLPVESKPRRYAASWRLHLSLTPGTPDRALLLRLARQWALTP